jgi:hypothetical protein
MEDMDKSFILLIPIFPKDGSIWIKMEEFWNDAFFQVRFSTVWGKEEEQEEAGEI